MKKYQKACIGINGVGQGGWIIGIGFVDPRPS